MKLLKEKGYTWRELETNPRAGMTEKTSSVAYTPKKVKDSDD